MRASEAKVQVEAGAALFREGDLGDYAVYLERGRVEISVSRQGQRVVLGQKGPGELFGEMAIIDGRRRAATVTALTRCELILITRGQLRTRLEQADPVLRLCLSLLMDRLRSTVEHIQGVDGPSRLPRAGLRPTAPAPPRLSGWSTSWSWRSPRASSSSIISRSWRWRKAAWPASRR